MGAEAHGKWDSLALALALESKMDLLGEKGTTNMDWKV
jgi:hypothetical protein